MDKTSTKKTKAFLTFFLALTCFATFSQTDSTKKAEQQKQEYLTDLKKWYDSGNLIVEVSISESNVVFVDDGTGTGKGYFCGKAKINRVLKGNLNAGYINIDINSPQKTEVGIVDGGADNSKIIGERALIKIHKSAAKEGFTTENLGVYVTDGKVYRMFAEGFDTHGKWVDGKKVEYNSTEALYKALKDCCGYNREKKVQ